MSNETAATPSAATVAPKAAKPDFDAAGVPGGPFTLRGQFGPRGSVTFGGQGLAPEQLTAWMPEKVKGVLPKDVDMDAEIVVRDAEGKVQKGSFRATAKFVERTRMEMVAQQAAALALEGSRK